MIIKLLAIIGAVVVIVFLAVAILIVTVMVNDWAFLLFPKKPHDKKDQPRR